VLVVVPVVRGVPAPVVDVVDVIAVRHGHMATSFAVNVIVIVVHGVVRRFALVVVTVVLSMKVTVVHIVDVVPVWDRDVAASLAVDVVVISVFGVRCGGHGLPPFRPKFDP
jgi:hypothetical protein